MGDNRTSNTLSASGMAPGMSARGISADALKIIAMAAMLIDHIGYYILEGTFLVGLVPVTDQKLLIFIAQMDLLMRAVGRIAFPIFCYLLVMGFFHTGNLKKYAGRLLVFAFISEIPFNLGASDHFFYPAGQNVFFTLFIGLMTVSGLAFLKERAKKSREEKPFVRLALCCGYPAITLLGMLCALVLKTDYDYKGVVLIVALYLFWDRGNSLFVASPFLFLASIFLDIPLGIGSIVSTVSLILLEAFCIFGFVLMKRCNGQRRFRRGKYFFYLFYPAHLLLLQLIHRLLMTFW